MADEARLNELLDLVEQARSEGDKETEAKAVAAYKRESAPAIAAPPSGVPVPQRPPEMAPPEQANTWGNAIKNVAQAAGHFGTGMVGGIAGDVAGLGAIAVNLMNPMVRDGNGIDPEAVRDKVASALTYTPENRDSLSTSIADFPSKVLSGTSAYLKDKATNIGGEGAHPYLGDVAGGIPLAVANLLGIKGAALARGMEIPAGKMGNLGTEAIYKQVPGASVAGVAAAKVPTTEELGKAATAAYKRADDSGIAMKAESFEKMKTELADDLTKGGIDPTLHPKATAALKRVTAEEGPITLQKAETLRRVALDAEDTLEKSDARNAGKIVDALDDYIDNLSDTDLVSGQAKDAGALKEARALYTRKRKGEDIERLVERAKLSASGFENGLRIEFRSLAKNDRRIKRFNPEEQAAIKKVAQGGAVENTLRLLGKAAPTGIVAGGIGMSAGAAMGGFGGAAAVPIGGWLAREAAKHMTAKNASRAGEVMRRGPTGGLLAKPEAVQSAAQPQGLLAGTASSAAQARTRSAADIRADIRRLSARAQFELGKESAGSPKIQEFAAELTRLQNELAAIRADQ